MDNVPDLPLHQSRSSADRGLKNCAESPHPALCGFNECSHFSQSAALSKTPYALADHLMPVFQRPPDMADCSKRLLSNTALETASRQCAHL
jgi:hypothetical protein